MVLEGYPQQRKRSSMLVHTLERYGAPNGLCKKPAAVRDLVVMEVLDVPLRLEIGLC